MVRRVFDCCLFDGDMDMLAIRFHELNELADHFIIVESNLTMNGVPREIAFDPCHPSVTHFAAKVRHVAVADVPTVDPRGWKEWLRNAVLRGAPDAAPSDLLILSDSGEIPSRSAVAEMVRDRQNESFGFRLAVHCLYVNYRNVGGPEAAVASAVAATRQRLRSITPDALRYAVRHGQEPARIFAEGGWRFSHLAGRPGTGRKNGRIDIARLVRAGRDPLDRPGSVWKTIPDTGLPVWLRENRRRLEHLFHPVGLAERVRRCLSRSTVPASPLRQSAPPVVICPYLYDHEAPEIRAKFGLSGKSSDPEFFLWQDKDRIGPEFAFEHCWNQFPERDIVIVHSDMAPMPGEPPERWYNALWAYRDMLPSAGMIACNLFYPTAAATSPARVQCAGGTFEEGVVDHLHGPLVETPNDGEGISRALLARVRPVDWVTFGGVLIRREVIHACGRFDRRYQWAYVMDVDYCFEARLRGFRLVQVPVSLQHEENRTTRSLWEQTPELKDHIAQNLRRFHAKWEAFNRAVPSAARFASAPSSEASATVRESASA